MISSSALDREIVLHDQALVVMPFLDATMAQRASHQLAKRSGCPGLLLAVHDDHREGFVKLINRAFALSQSAVFVYTAQDAFAGRDWLAIASRALTKGKAGLAAFNDGKWAGQMAAFGLADRQWAKSVYGGPLFFPEYNSHYADTELSVIARSQMKYCYDPDAILVEVDWDKESKLINSDDRSIFNNRKTKYFDRETIDEKLLNLFI